jgi:uncharacterized protein
MTPDADSRREQQARLCAALKNPTCFGGDVEHVTALETHISYVFLTGRFAYKIKKAVDFGFLDFTTLSARRFYCEEELRLNRRLAPALYLEVVPITGPVDAPRIDGEGPALEYAVKMREFPQDALASRLLARGELPPRDVDALAAAVARFHASIEVAAPDAGFGAPESICRTAIDNCDTLRRLADGPDERQEIEALARWTEREASRLRGALATRLARGFVRECHGDLHLGNIARIDGELTIFDCIEFNPGLRWIDVMSELAFVVMDLEYRQRSDLARRFLNAYLEITGDYAGLEVLRFYLAYRALVRAKVARLRVAQLPSGDAGREGIHDSRAHERLAHAYAAMPQRAIVITHGLSGSGKTTLSQGLVETLGAVRVRSDVERKRLHGMDVLARDRGGVEHGLYGGEATEATYAHLAAVAREIVEAGFIAVVDAAFLKRRQRDVLRRVAVELQVPFVIVDFVASESVLRERIANRTAAGTDASDADLAVLRHQLRTEEPFAVEESDEVVRYDANAAVEYSRAPEAWRSVRERIETALHAV